MIKTNSRAAMLRIREHIADNYCPDGYDQYEQSDDLKVIAHNILDCFYKEKVEHDKRRMIYEDLFLEWLSGLPTILHCGYIIRSNAVDVLGDILEETEEERNRYPETRAEELFGQLIYRELLRLSPVWPFA